MGGGGQNQSRSNTPLGAKRLCNYRCFGTEHATGVPNGSVIIDVLAPNTPLGCQTAQYFHVFSRSNMSLGLKNHVFPRICLYFHVFSCLSVLLRCILLCCILLRCLFAAMLTGCLLSRPCVNWLPPLLRVCSVAFLLRC